MAVKGSGKGEAVEKGSGTQELPEPFSAASALSEPFPTARAFNSSPSQHCTTKNNSADVGGSGMSLFYSPKQCLTACTAMYTHSRGHAVSALYTPP